MLKRVDEQENEEITGFSYSNLVGDLEYVDISDSYCEGKNSTVTITAKEEGVYFHVYTDDIPKLVLALQAAYEHLKGN